MRLSSGDAGRVQSSYAEIRHRPNSFAGLFYHRLLDRHPFARALFPDDMEHQIEVFQRTVDTLVEQLDDLPSLEPTLVNLARRHVLYGVEAKHYAYVGEVLIDTFAELLGDTFDPDTKAAWEALYTATAGVMIAAAYPALER